MLSEPVHGIFDGGVCATSKALDQPAHARSLTGAFACRLRGRAGLGLGLSECHIVGGHMPRL